MTTPVMGRRYIEEASGRMDLVRLAFDKQLWASVVREAQECVELFLKGALRLVAVEPSRTHDVAEILRAQAARFPQWFQVEVAHLASTSTELAGDRGVAFYGDERLQQGPQDLFDEKDARRALDLAEYVATLVQRLLMESAGSEPPA